MLLPRVGGAALARLEQFGGGTRIRTWDGVAEHLQSASFNHSDSLRDCPGFALQPDRWKSRRSGSNGRPADYKSAALPTELRRPVRRTGEENTVPRPRCQSAVTVWHHGVN